MRRAASVRDDTNDRMPKTKLTRWKLVGAALLFLAAAAALYLTYRMCWLGRISVEAEPEAPAAYAPVDSNFRVAVLLSGYTTKFLANAPRYETHAQYWRKLIQSLGLSCDLTSDSQLETDLKGYRVLILPSAVCLSEKEKKNIRAFLKDGGGVICTWATRARDENGDWKGLDFLTELTGADSFRFTDRPAPWFVAFAAAPAGLRVQVASPERMEATALNVDGYWCDGRLFPVDSAQPASLQGCVLHSQIDRGRVVWYGFQENSAVAEGNDKATLDLVLTNGLAWAGRRVLCAIDPWPSPYSGAALLALDVEEDYHNASYAADALLKNHTKGTFFCVSDTARTSRDLLRSLKRTGEIAVHGNTHAPFGQAAAVSQLVRLQSARWTFWRLGGTWASGFHPPGETWNTETLQALAGARFRYYVVGAGGNSVLPTIFRVSQSVGMFRRERELVRLQRTTADDLHLSPLGILGLSPQWIVQRIMADFGIVRDLGGLYVLAYHTQGLSAPEYVTVFPQLLGQFQQNSTWIATADEIAGWWVTRSLLAVSVLERGEGSVRLTVISRAVKPIEGVVLSVYPPASSLQVRAVPVVAQMPAPQVIQDPSSGRMQLRLGRLEPGKTYSYDLILEH